MGPSTKSPLLSPSEIETLVNDGAVIVIYRNAVLKVDSWLKNHPGGDKILLHMVGRDATDQINAFHSVETLKTVSRYQMGRIEGGWDNFVPPIQRASEGKNVLEVEHWMKRDEENESVVSSRASSVFESDGMRKRGLRAESPASSLSSSTEDISKIEKEIEGGSSRDVATSTAQEVEEDAIVSSFRELVARLEAEGFYDCNYWLYLTEVIRISSIFTVMLLLLHFKQYFLSSMAMGTFWHQLVFIAHDAGHMGITHNYQTDTLIGLIISSTLGGLSLSWWKSSHNIHHIATNSPSHDPDIQQMPFLAVTPSFFSSLYSTYYSRIMPFTPFSAFVLKYQHHLYYPLLCFGRFNLYFLSLQHLILNKGPKNALMAWHRRLELLGQAIFWYWFGYRLLYLSLPNLTTRILYIFISHAITMPLHVQFTLSHFAMSTSPPLDASTNEPWAKQQLRTTMDVDCPPWMDWFHGGLQFQAIHHLFPRLPRHNLRRAQGVVREWARGNGVQYEVYGFVECNGRVLGRLEEVGRQAGFLREAARVTVEKGEWLRGEWE